MAGVIFEEYLWCLLFFGGGCFASLSSPTVYYNVCPSSRPIMPSWSEWKYMTQAHLIHIPPLGIWISNIKTESNWNYAIQDNPRDGRWVPMPETRRTILFLIFLWPDYLIVFQSLCISPNPFSKFVAILLCIVLLLASCYSQTYLVASERMWFGFNSCGCGFDLTVQKTKLKLKKVKQKDRSRKKQILMLKLLPNYPGRWKVCDFTLFIN